VAGQAVNSIWLTRNALAVVGARRERLLVPGILAHNAGMNCAPAQT
jgi:hypothetical protein